MNNRLTRQIIEEMDRQEMTITKMAKELKRSKQYVSKLLNGGNMSIRIYCDMLKVLNLSIVILPKRYLTNL